MNTIGRTVSLVAARRDYPRGDFLGYLKQRNRRQRLRRLLRGGAGLLVILLVWQFASQWLDLELLLPQPLVVLRNVIGTLTVSDPHWLYGPNIYVHLSHSFLRAMAGFVTAAVVAIPLGLALGRITALREFIMPSIQGFIRFPGSPGSHWRFYGSVSATRRSCLWSSPRPSSRCCSMPKPARG